LKAAWTHLSQWQVLDDVQRFAPGLWAILNKVRVADEPIAPGEPSSNDKD